jgi:hypothetical protein
MNESGFRSVQLSTLVLTHSTARRLRSATYVPTGSTCLLSAVVPTIVGHRAAAYTVAAGSALATECMNRSSATPRHARVGSLPHRAARARDKGVLQPAVARAQAVLGDTEGQQSEVPCLAGPADHTRYKVAQVVRTGTKWHKWYEVAQVALRACPKADLVRA